MAKSAVRKSLQLRHYSEVIVRWFWFLGLCALLAGGGAYVVTKLQKPVYRATTLIIVDQQASGQDPYSSLLASDQLVTTYVNLITQPAVLEKAASQAAGTTIASLQSRVQASSQTGTQIIQIQVDDTSPVRAANLANAVAQAFIIVQQNSTLSEFNAASQLLDQELAQVTSQIDSLTNQINTLQASNPSDPTIPQLKQQLNSAEERRSSLQTADNQLTLQDITSSNDIRIFQSATPPTSPDHPKPLTNALIGAVLGLLLALCVVLLREFLDDRVRTPEQIENLTGVATIGTITARDKGSLLLSVKDNSRLLDSFGIIRTNLSFVSHDRTLRSIVVTSPVPYEGKSTTAINLAISLAWSGKRVLLMDADLRRPTIHKRLEIQNVGGLSLILLHGKQNDTIATVPGVENLYVLTAGPTPPNPTELLESKRMHQLLQTIQDSTQIDIVVIDTPPALGFADVAVLAAQVDGVILTLNAQHTREVSLIETMEVFKKVKARIVGIILIDVKENKPNSYLNSVYDTSSRRA